MSRINTNYNLPGFLTEPKYRIWRYLILIMVMMVITFNMVFIAYQDCSNILRGRIYMIGFSLLMLYLFTMWLNYSVLVPRFLLKNKYPAYFLILSVIVLILPISTIVQEYWIRNTLGLPHRINSYTNPLILIDSLSSFVMIFICLFGIPVMVFLRRWMATQEEVGRMKYEHIRSEINKLKGQVAPGFLSKTLNNAESFIKSNPSKTSHMLMKLSQLLRYQLYDCNRDKVLLNSEINFINGYLALEQLNREVFQYRVHTNGNLNNIFVSPMLFISIIQTMIDNINFLNVSFHTEKGILTFECQSDKELKLETDVFFPVRKSLDLQYPDKYILSIETRRVVLQINISDEWR